MTTSNTIVLKDIPPTPFNSNSRIMFINNLTGEIFVSTTEDFTSVILNNTPVLSSTIYKINNKTPDAQNSVTLVANDINAYTKQEVNSTFLKVNFSNLSGNIDVKGYKIENLDLTDPVSDGDAISNFYLNKRINELLAGEITSINNKTPDENGNVTLTAQDVSAYTTLQVDAIFRTKSDSYSREELNSNVNTNISDPDSDNNIANKHYVDTVLLGKADTSHTHIIGDLKYDNTTYLESWLGITYAQIDHTHIINEITGLQSSLDSKADLTYLDNYATTQALNNGLSGKANTTDLVNYLKKDGSTLLNNTYIPNDNLSIATKGYVDGIIPAVLLKKRNFNRSWTTTTAGTIAGNASVRILDRLAYNPILGIEPLNTTFNYTSGTNSFIKELNGVDLPDKILRVILRVKNNAAMGNTQLEFSLFRQSDNTEVGGADNVVINDPDTRGISFELSSRSFGSTDSFVLTGYYVVLRNLTPTALAYNNIELLIQVSRDIGY